MAHVLPFRALRYDPARTPLQTVLTQPYDKVTPAMQERYYAASPFNLVRVILGRSEAGDDEQRNVYTRAAELLRQWRREGVLVQDNDPAVYAYTQRFTPPGTRDEFERSSFIALGRLHDYSEGVIFRHEQTLSGPKLDRLRLMRATRTHCESIFMLYDDADATIDALLTPGRRAEVEVTDEYGVIHSLAKIADPDTLNELTSRMKDQRLVIADGHHRYETALAFRDEKRAAADNAGDGAAHDLMLMTFVNRHSPGLVILPTHRVISGLPGFDEQRVLADAGEFFDVGPEAEPESAALRLSQPGAEDRTGFLMVLPRSSYRVRIRPAALRALQGELSPRQAALTVVQLHKLMIERVLGISEAAVRAGQHITYHREAAEVIQQVRSGANAGFIIPPASVGQVCEVALAGEVMPQKSTDFYPKLLSGLVMYALD